MLGGEPSLGIECLPLGTPLDGGGRGGVEDVEFASTTGLDCVPPKDMSIS